MKERWKNVGYYKTIEDLFVNFISKSKVKNFKDVIYPTGTKTEDGELKRAKLNFHHMKYYWNGFMGSLNAADADPILPDKMRQLMYQILCAFYDHQKAKKVDYIPPTFPITSM